MEIRWLTMILPARYPSAFEFEHARHASPPVSAAHAMRRAAMMEYVTPRPVTKILHRNLHESTEHDVTKIIKV
eukprot:1392652-Amorphochlora_amoeboformis.AAC.2